MRDPKRKLTKAGDLTMNFCAGTCSTAKAFMLLQKHGKILGCDVHPQVLRSRSDISESCEAQAAAKVLTDQLGAFLSRKKAAA